MTTAEFSLEDSQIQWLEQCQSFGFKDKSELVRTAINGLREQLKQPQSLRESAQIYADIYETDEETIALTEAAIVGSMPLS